MKRTTPVFALGGILLFGAIAVPTAAADEWDKKTSVTFDSPFEIPGVHRDGSGVLPAGTYIFKLLDSQANRHIVQIFSKDGKTVHATILAIPNYRLQATDRTVVTFSERPAGQPEALRAWFYPGRNWGEEFVYPKAKAIELARVSNTPVLFTPVTLPVAVDEPLPSKETDLAALTAIPVMAATPSGTEVELAQVVTPPPDAWRNVWVRSGL